MKINIKTIHMTTDIPNCMIIQVIQQATAKDDYLQQLRVHIIKGCLESRNEVPQ